MSFESQIRKERTGHPHKGGKQQQGYSMSGPRNTQCIHPRIIADLEEQNARLRTQLDNAHKAGFEAGELANRLAAELEALKPKPLSTVRTYDYSETSDCWFRNPYDKGQLSATFEDGTLVKAEVI